MAQFSSDYFIEQLDSILASPIVHGTIVTELRFSVNIVFNEGLASLVSFITVPPSESDKTLFEISVTDIGYYFRQTFINILKKADDSHYKEALCTFLEVWRPVNQRLVMVKDVPKYTNKPRKPKESPLPEENNYAVCPCCFQTHKMTHVALTRHPAYGEFGARDGNCNGSGQAHFGTEHGEKLARGISKNYRRLAKARYAHAEAILEGDVIPFDGTTMLPLVDPSQNILENIAHKLRVEADKFDRMAKIYEDKLVGWYPQDPIKVTK